MILQELVRYADRQRRLQGSDIAPPGWVRRAVDYILVLNAQGKCVNLLTNFVVERGRRESRSELLPAIGKQALKHTNAGNDANLLWDVASFSTGFGDERGTKLESFLETIQVWFVGLTDAGVDAVRLFAERAMFDPGAMHELMKQYGVLDDFEKRDPVVAFQLLQNAPSLVHASPAVRQQFEQRRQAERSCARQGDCLVSGVRSEPLVDNETVIKGVSGSQTSGANIAAFNKPSFSSYGKGDQGGPNAPISIDSSEAYTTALNHLLEAKGHRAQIGDTSTVFWADSAEPGPVDSLLCQLFGEQADDPASGVRTLKALLDAPRRGVLPILPSDPMYFVLGLAAPSGARLTVRFWRAERAAALAKRIIEYFNDLRIVQPSGVLDTEVLPSVNEMLAAIGAPTANRGDDTLYSKIRRSHVRVPRGLVGDALKAIFNGTPYPRQLFNLALIRCHAEHASKDNTGRAIEHVSPMRAAILKACLNRHSRIHSDSKEVPMALDEKCDDTYYRLGRLFALYEKIQQAVAGRELNRSIRDGYFGAAMTAPRSVFSRLARLAEIHLRDLKREKAGLAVYFEREIGRIVYEMPVAQFAPASATLEQQARFVLGYYHQRHTRRADSGEGQSSTTSEE